MTDETILILKHYFLLRKSGCNLQLLQKFTEMLCAAKEDERDAFADAVRVSFVLEEIATEPQKQRATRKDKGTTRGPKPVTAVA